MDQRQFLRIIEPILKPLKTRIMMAIARGIIESVKDDGGIQGVKVSLLKDEVRDNLERVQEFGFTSNPPAGSEAVAIFVGGNREHGFIVACDHRASRKKNLQPGECAIYTDDGTYLILKKGGQVEIKAATKLTVDVPNCEFKGDVVVTGKIDATGNITSTGNVVGGGTSLSAVKSAYNAHQHVETGVTTATPLPPLV